MSTCSYFLICSWAHAQLLIRSKWYDGKYGLILPQALLDFQCNWCHEQMSMWSWAVMSRWAWTYEQMSSYERVLIVAHWLMSTCSSAHIKGEWCWITGHFYTDRASEMICKFCGKTFNRSFNLRRHENKYCPLKDQEREISETESQTMESEGDSSIASTHGSESPVTTDSWAHAHLLIRLEREKRCGFIIFFSYYFLLQSGT
jgi:hypothetical protein